MEYSINPSALFTAFPVPCVVADRHLRLATEVQLKVLLCALRSLADGINAGRIADTLGLPLSEIEDALLYWIRAGVFTGGETEPIKAEPVQAPPVVQSERPSRTDVAERGLEDPKVRFLMREAQQRFGRSLKTNESTLLLWLYDDQGMDVSVILLLLQFAISQKKLNIRFIEKTAVSWIENGVQSVRDAENRIADTVRMQSAWGVVETVFGIERRQPSTRELELSDRWINEWKLSRELLKKAYDTCIDKKSKLSVPYIAKILESWHQNGFKTAEDVDNAKLKRKTATDDSFAAYDMDAFERMLNSND